MIVPPFAGVALVECHDELELRPFYSVREFVGLGRHKASEVGPPEGDPMHPFFSAVMGEREIWVIATWRRYEDGSDEKLGLDFLDPEATEADARKVFDNAVSFQNLSKKELEELSGLFEAKPEDLAYVEERFPNFQTAASSANSIEDSDLYQARLKVLAGFQPKTVELILRAEATADPQAREIIERQAVQAYFGDMAQEWTEEEVMAWQRSNPVGTEWMCHFARVFHEPERRIDPVNHELALNWLRRKYNLLTAEELSDAILVATGQRVMPATLKKKRERLGLTTKRPPGPRPNSEQ